MAPRKALEHGINSFANEGNPSLSPDREWFYFTSERSGFQAPLRRRMNAAAWYAAIESVLNGRGASATGSATASASTLNGLGNIYEIPLKSVLEPLQ